MVVESKAMTPTKNQNKKMKTKSFHASNMGSFGGCLPTDSQGYVTIHDSPRYARATDDQLAEWTESKMKAVCAAALTEQANRNLRDWMAKNR